MRYAARRRAAEKLLLSTGSIGSIGDQQQKRRPVDIPLLSVADAWPAKRSFAEIRGRRPTLCRVCSTFNDNIMTSSYFDLDLVCSCPKIQNITIVREYCSSSHFTHNGVAPLYGLRREELPRVLDDSVIH